MRTLRALTRYAHSGVRAKYFWDSLHRRKVIVAAATPDEKWDYRIARDNDEKLNKLVKLIHRTRVEKRTYFHMAFSCRQRGLAGELVDIV